MIYGYIWYIIIWSYMMCIITLYVCVYMSVCACVYIKSPSLPITLNHMWNHTVYTVQLDETPLESENKIHFLCTFMFCRGVILQENHVTSWPLLKHFRAFLYDLYTHFKLTWHTNLELISACFSILFSWNCWAYT